MIFFSYTIETFSFLHFFIKRKYFLDKSYQLKFTEFSDYVQTKLLWFDFSFILSSVKDAIYSAAIFKLNQIPDLWDFLLVILSNCHINESSVQINKKGKKKKYIYQHLCINNANVHIMIFSTNIFDWKDCVHKMCVGVKSR